MQAETFYKRNGQILVAGRGPTHTNWGGGILQTPWPDIDSKPTCLQKQNLQYTHVKRFHNTLAKYLYVQVERFGSTVEAENYTMIITPTCSV